MTVYYQNCNKLIKYCPINFEVVLCYSPFGHAKVSLAKKIIYFEFF